MSKQRRRLYQGYIFFFYTEGLLSALRCSTIEVHPKFYEVPHSRSSIPHSKTDFSKNQNASRWILPWLKSTKRFRFEVSTIWGKKKPVFQKKQLAEMCYLYRRTGPLFCFFKFGARTYCVLPFFRCFSSGIFGVAFRGHSQTVVVCLENDSDVLARGTLRFISTVWFEAIYEYVC